MARERAAEVDAAGLARQIELAEESGLRIAVVAPIEPLPDSEAFARRILEASGEGVYDAILVLDPEGKHQVAVVEKYQSRILRSIQSAQGGASPTDSVSRVTAALLSEPQPSVPAAIDVVDHWVIRLVVILAVAVMVDLLWRQRRRRKYLAQLTT